MIKPNSPSEIFEILKTVIPKLNSSSEAAWYGCKSPISCTSIDFDKGTNYRVSPCHHGKYKTVWLYENNIFDHPNWPIVIDESLRLIDRDGYVIVRYIENNKGTSFGLKNIIARHPNRKVELVTQISSDDAGTVCVLRVRWLNSEIYTQNKWTIGILSNGAKNNNVERLLRSIREQAGTADCEVIIAGPQSKTFLEFEPKYIFQDARDRLPRISEKKQAIIEAASHENVALIHDRYILNEGFFSGFDKWGYHFDFCTVKQQYENGAKFPAYCGFGALDFKWQPPLYDSSFNKSFNAPFLNGGLLIVKRSIANKIPFNELLLHNEAEDVEFAWAALINGIRPRINFASKAVTIDTSSEHTSSYIDCASKRNILKGYLIGLPQKQLVKAVWMKLPEKLKTLIRKTGVYNAARDRFSS